MRPDLPGRERVTLISWRKGASGGFAGWQAFGLAMGSFKFSNSQRWRCRSGVFFAFAALFGTSGCGTFGDLFVPDVHPDRARDYREAVESREARAMRGAAKRALGRSEDASGLLYTMEAARLYSLAGDFEESIRLFEAASDRFEGERQQPLFRVSENLLGAAALATSDRALPYESAGYERFMAHNLLALDHIRTGRLDFAQIALNGALAEQDYLRTKYAHLDEAVAQSMQQSSVRPGAVQNAYEGEAARLRSNAAEALRPYQNAFTSYLSGILFAVSGDRDRAAIAMRAAGRLYPENPYIAESVQEAGIRAHPDDVLVVVCLEDGWIPMKQAVGLPFFWGGTILQVVVPTYGSRGSRRVSPAFVFDGEPLGRTAIIGDLDAQARQELADAYPRIVLRQALRLITKYQVQQQLEQEHAFAGFAAQVFNLLTDQADERSWLTLPARLEVAHFSVAPGQHRLGLAGEGIDGVEATLDLPPGSTIFLLVTRTHRALYQDWALFDSQGRSLQNDPPITSSTTRP